MASPGDEVKCAICVQRFTELPRKLPGCSHSFCEGCIVNLVLNLRKENETGDEAGGELSCPVCKLPSDSPGIDDSIHRWVSALEHDESVKPVLVGEIKPNMEKCCSHCLSEEKFVVSDRYCIVCKEQYCKSCSDIIHSFNVNKGHVVMETDKQESSGPHEQAMKLLSELTTCSDHPKEPVAFYCIDDKKFACAVCVVKSHRTCKQCEPIPDFEEQESSKADSTKLLDLTAKLTKHIDSIAAAIRRNNDENKEIATQINADFQEMKQKVVNLLDILEANLVDEGNGAVKNAAMKIQDELDDLNSWKNTLKTVTYMLENIVETLTAKEAFICMRQLKHTVDNVEKDIIGKGRSVKATGIELTTTETFQLIQNLGPNETSQLASVSMPETSIAIPVYEDRPFLREFNIQKTGAHKLIPDPYNPGERLTPTYNCLLFLPGNGLLLVDSFYGFCCVVDEEFNLGKKWTALADTPLDSLNPFCNERHAVYMGHNIVAVSVASEKTIIFVTSDGNYEEKIKLKCEYVPKALVSLNNGDIAVAWDKPVAFGVISDHIWPCQGKLYKALNGSSYCEKVHLTQDNSGRQLKSFRYMAVDEDRRHVIQPCSVDKSVYCFDMTGNHMFCYANENLKDPSGVALDSRGNIFICDPRSIHIVSPKGIGITLIKDGCPKKPLAVGFDKTRENFAVSDDYDFSMVHFFSIRAKSV